MSNLIKNMSAEEKPRERLKKYGANNLTDEELIAIILRCGTFNNSAKDIAKQLTKEITTVKNFPELTISRLIKIKGIGEVKAITLIAAIELGKRVLSLEKSNKLKITNANIVYDLFKYDLVKEKQENFLILLLDNKKQLLNFKVIFKGTINLITIHPREVFKEALLNSASAIILVHNHPSGDINPSEEDKNTTQNLIQVGLIMQIPVIDHIIIGHNSYYSFYDHKEMR